jgi:hypothetical protein
LGASKMISKPIVRLALTVHLSCTDTNTISKRIEKEISYDPCHLGVPSGASKMISKPMARSKQIRHQSCVKISTMSKQTKMCFHLSLFTWEDHRVHPLRFLSIWYVWHKPCNYHAPTLAPSPNGPKRDST